MIPPPWINPAFRLIEDGREYDWTTLSTLARKLQSGMQDGGRFAVGNRSIATLIAAVIAAERAGAELVLQRAGMTRPAGASALIDSDGRFVKLGPSVDTTTGFALLLPTSGTTGTPKLVRHQLNRLMGRVRGGAGRDARWLMTYEPTAYAGFQVTLSALAAGATLVFHPNAGVAVLAQEAVRHKVTHVSGTPSFWRAFLLAMGGSKPPLQAITLGGEAADQSILDRLSANFPSARIRHVYASTEAGVLFSVSDGRAGFPARWLHTGVDGVNLRVQNGVLEVRSPHAMLGYAGSNDRPHTTADGWFVSGDLIEIIDDRVFFNGRVDGAINVGGVKVAPEKIEHFLMSVPGVLNALVSGARNPITGNVLRADVVPETGVDQEALRALIFQHTAVLPPAERPRLINFVDTLAYALSGKKIRPASDQAHELDAPESAADSSFPADAVILSAPQTVRSFDSFTAPNQRHVIVTGGSRGLGLVLVRALLTDGYTVSTCSRNPSEGLDRLRADPILGPRLFWKPVHIGKTTAIATFIEAAAQNAGAIPLYGLINNAGIAREGILATFPEVEIDEVIQTNLVGAIQAARAFLRAMLLRNGHGRIINISSIIGLSGYTGLTAYSASKAGMDGMTRGLAREVGRRGITVNSVAPGYLTTEMSSTLSRDQRDQIVRRTPLGRLGEPADVIPIIRFLLSDDSAFITGQTFVVDGGITS
ncbi:hypothetical protein CCP2SC5_60015 [Azospirillaceae bacterium]